MEENKEFNLEIGEPIVSEFDYSLSPAELDKRLSEEMDAYKQGKRKTLTHEFSMVGYALDFIDFAKSRCNVEIDFGEEHFETFRGILNALKNMFVKNPPPDEFFGSMVKKATGYYGIMIIKNIGGQWVETNLGMGIKYKGKNVLIMNQISKFLKIGEDNLAGVYKILKEA